MTAHIFLGNAPQTRKVFVLISRQNGQSWTKWWDHLMTRSLCRSLNSRSILSTTHKMKSLETRKVNLPSELHLWNIVLMGSTFLHYWCTTSWDYISSKYFETLSVFNQNVLPTVCCCPLRHWLLRKLNTWSQIWTSSHSTGSKNKLQYILAL